jgi:nucleosome binding factor SPN SPT16 subunit
MVKIILTLNCLVNLIGTPFFVDDLDEVYHVHFERVIYTRKAFDIVLVNEDVGKRPWRIDMIPNGDKVAIQHWLTDMAITYTEGPMNLNWRQIMATAKEYDRFYVNTEEDEVTEKEAGCECIRMFGRDDEAEEDDGEDDSEFDENKVETEASDESETDDFDLVSEEVEFEADEEVEEQGMDWDDMEAEAAADDKRKTHQDDQQYDPLPAKRRPKGNRHH